MKDHRAVIDQRMIASSHHFSSSCCFGISMHFSVTPLMFRIFYVENWRKSAIFQTFKGGLLLAALSFGGSATHHSTQNLLNFKFSSSPKRCIAYIGVQVIKTANFEVTKSRSECIQMLITRSYVVLRHQFFFSFDRGDSELEDERNQSSVGRVNLKFWGKMWKNCKIWQKNFQKSVARPWSICGPRSPWEKDSPLYVLSFGIQGGPKWTPQVYSRGTQQCVGRLWEKFNTSWSYI